MRDFTVCTTRGFRSRRLIVSSASHKPCKNIRIDLYISYNNEISNKKRFFLSYREESTFRPNINEKSKLMIRKGRVEDNLYRDAQKRKERLDTLKSEVEQ